MEEGYSIQRLLVLRKLTVAISRLLSEQMREYLTTLAPLLRPKAVLGDYIQSNIKEPSRPGAEKAFKELQSLYEQIAGSKPFNLPTELKPPIEIVSTALEFTPLEYEHSARTADETKMVVVTSPLKWVLNYSGFSLGRLKTLVADRNRSSSELREFILHYLVLNVVISKQTGVTNILETLHFPVTSEHYLPELGRLPVTQITSSISTHLPPDNVIIESTEISGRNVFEEVIQIADIVKLRDPLRERLTELIQNQAPDLMPTSTED
ncbi:MAG TPA: hypothetical protein VGB73_02010 [Pyrinomonadaceae bacterium]|jgi:hypothetical protein